MNRRIFAVARIETLQIARDPRTIVWIFGLPALLLLIFGYAITLDIKSIPTVVIDTFPSAESREIIQTIESSGYFDIVLKQHLPLFNENYFIHGLAKIAIIFPADFQVKYARREQVSIQLLVDGADNNTAMIAMGYLQKILTAQNLVQLEKEAIKSGKIYLSKRQISAKTRIWYNQELKSKVFIIPGLVAIILGMMNVILTALCIIRERERGTFEQLIVTPLRKWELIVGKTIPYYLCGILQFVLAILVSRYFFGIPIKGSLLEMTFVTLIFLLAGIGQGILISITSSSQAEAMQTAMITSMLPGFILSGFMFPIESMIDIVRYISTIVPARYFLEALRTLMVKGVSITEIPVKVLFLGGVAVVFYLLSYVKMKKYIE